MNTCPRQARFSLPARIRLKVIFIPQQDPDNQVEAEVPFTVNKILPMVTWHQPEPISYGAPLGDAQLNAISNTWMAGWSTTRRQEPCCLKACMLSRSIFIPNDPVNYNTAVNVASLTVSRMIPHIEWPDPAPIFYGARLSATELNARASVPGSFAYAPKEGIATPGWRTQADGDVPAGAERVLLLRAKPPVTLIVARATPEARWQQPPGYPLRHAARPRSTSRFNPKSRATSSSAPTWAKCFAPAGTRLIAYFTPEDAVNFSESEFEATLNVAKRMPALTWHQGAQIVFGTPLDESHLNAQASVPGAIEYTPEAGKVLTAGRHTVIARFTPDDAKNLEVVEAHLPLTVEKATPAVEWPAQISMVYGMPLDDRVFRISTAVEGSLALTPAKGELLPAGMHIVHAVFVPADSANYLTGRSRCAGAGIQGLPGSDLGSCPSRLPMARN